MTPILYESTEIDFINQGLGALAEIYDVDIHEQRNGIFQLTANYPVTGLRYADIQVDNIILAKPSPRDEEHAFRIVNIELDLTGAEITIEADSITYDLRQNTIDSLIITNLSGSTFMDKLQASLTEKTQFRLFSDISTIASTTIEAANAMETIAGVQGSFLQTYGGELKRENKQVSMLARRGRSNVATFRLGKNINGLKYTISTEKVVTKIYPFVKLQDNRVIKGAPVSSKNINNYPIVHALQVDVSEKITLPEQIIEKDVINQINAFSTNWFTQSANTGRDSPEVAIEIDVLSLQDSSDYQDKFKDLETVGLTDTVNVYVPEFGINVDAVVNEIHYDPIDERIKSLAIGTARLSFSDANRNTLSDMNSNIARIDERANSAMISADGKSRVYRGPSQPLNPQEGDLWFWTNGDMAGIRIFEYGQWNDRIDDEFEKRNDDAVDNAVNQAKDYTNEVASDTNKRLDGKADTAQIDVLKDQINLSVKKGDVINQINLDESGFQIKAKSVILDGPTTVTDAFYALGGNFKNLNASNITVGTLDASKIRVINIDASQITTGKISGLSMEFRANQGSKGFVLRDDAIRMYDDESFNIQSGEGIKIYKGSISSPNNGILIDVDNNFISSSSYAAIAMLKDGALFLTQPQIYDTNSNPYFSISNNGAGFSFYGARLMGREYVALTTSDNSNSGFDFALGQELFVGLAGGRNGNSWFPTKIGGASRGVVLSGGKAYGQFVASSPYIVVGSTPNGSAGSGYGGTRITLAGEYVQIPSAYNQTNSTPANLAVTYTGALVRTTSATKYKTSI
ncbi:phage tail spike protein, partial [Periweissella fabaria]|uniref:phage tail spike protein n=2 Tax=Periweissella fabaria TaxID=546157 RepID=UPI001E2A09E3